MHKRVDNCPVCCDFCEHFWPLARMVQGIDGAPPALVYLDGSGKCVYHEKETDAGRVRETTVDELMAEVDGVEG